MPHAEVHANGPEVVPGKDRISEHEDTEGTVRVSLNPNALIGLELATLICCYIVVGRLCLKPPLHKCIVDVCSFLVSLYSLLSERLS